MTRTAAKADALRDAGAHAVIVSGAGVTVSETTAPLTSNINTNLCKRLKEVAPRGVNGDLNEHALRLVAGPPEFVPPIKDVRRDLVH